jgi:predicted acyltransferase
VPGYTVSVNHPRLTSLDVLRGLTILGMIVVNNQGDGSHILPSLGHATWNGITLADLVFPFFLVIMGVSMAISFAKRRPSPWKILRRSALLFALGFFLNAFPHFDPAEVHIMGVLQRIALVYLATAFLVLYTPRRPQLATGAALLVGYFALMTLVPVPGHGAGILTPDGNLAGFIDRALLGAKHVYGNGPYDPEGLLSTLPAIVTTLIGFWAGDWVRTQQVGAHVTKRLAYTGLALAAAGAAWAPLFPINKKLWTSSYVLFTGGCALVLLAITYEAVEVRCFRRWGRPFEVLGLNAILVYMASEELAYVVDSTHFKPWLYTRVFTPFAGEILGSLFFSLTLAAVTWLLAGALYRRRLFLKV